MPQKGVSNNPAGRPVGAPNKATAEIKAILVQFIGSNIHSMQEDFDAIESPSMRLYFMERLMKYVMPTRVIEAAQTEDSNEEERMAMLKELAEIVNSRRKIE